MDELAEITTRCVTVRSQVQVHLLLVSRLNMRSALAVVVALMTVGCIESDPDKPDEEELLDDSKADSQRKPTDHGVTVFGLREQSVLTDAERYHAWGFEVTGDAKVTITTSYALLGQRKTDTVLYLYKEGPNGFGSYIARNDDYDGKVYSRIIKNVGAGRYRLLVKGYLATTMGKFSVTTGCEGDGCAPPPPSTTCLFGAVYGDLETAAGLEPLNSFKLTPANLNTLGDDLKALVVKAVQQ